MSDFTVNKDPINFGYKVSGYISDTDVHMYGQAVIKQTIEKVAQAIAEQYLHEHAQEILTAIDPQAVANLAIANSGAAVRESLEKSIPREVQHHYHNSKDVYKMGLFGKVTKL